jgi:sulfite exporter TauE/SafE
MDVKRWLRTNPDRAAAWVCVAVGVIVLFLGWEGASNTAYTAEQLPYILSGGIGGALLVAMGATLLISADLRDEWHKLDRIEKRLSTPLENVADQLPTSSGVDESAPEVAPPTATSNGRTRPLSRRPPAGRTRS